MSPTVLRVGGYRFYFFSREEPRAHVHVQHATGEAKFWLEPRVELAENYGLTASRINTQLSRQLGNTRMRSVQRGKSILAVEVTSVSPHGLWLLIGEDERFISFRDFPWFLEASIAEPTNVRVPSPHHLYWPDLDVDLAVESIEHPQRYPLLSRVPRPKRLRPPAVVKESSPPYRRTKAGRGSAARS